VKLCNACIFTVNFSAPAAQRISQVKWLTPVKPGKTPVQQVRCFTVLSFGLTPPTPPPPMKNARRAAAAGHKTTQRRRRLPVRRRTALVDTNYGMALKYFLLGHPVCMSITLKSVQYTKTIITCLVFRWSSFIHRLNPTRPNARHTKFRRRVHR